ncbi:MAG: hypothetical protein AB8G96_00925 [Phycisphaerales bacterium]
MPPRTIRPLSLTIVAWLFLLDGFGSVLGMIHGLANQRVWLSLGLLGIPVGFGLMRYRSGWRTCALALLWLEFLAIPVFLIVLASQNGRPYVQFWGYRQELDSTAPLYFMLPLVFLFALWQYRVLTRPDIRRRFRRFSGLG